MANFSVNQVKQLYVVKAVDSNVDTLGDIKFGATLEGDIYAKYMGNDGVVRTDLIKKNNIIFAKATKASAMAEFLDSAFVTISPIIAGQQYILNVTIDNFGSISPDNKGFIFSDYVAVTGDTDKEVIANLAISLAKNASKAAYNKLINVYVSTATTASTALTIGTNAWLVNANDDAATVEAYGTLKSIVIEAAEQPWTLGKERFELLHFSVSATPIVSNGVDTSWATVVMNTSHPSAALKNSKKIADLEYFCAGERGDIYRGMGYPNNFDFHPIVDPAAQYGYHLLNISYFWQGDAEDVQMSPKEIVIACPAEGDTTYTVMNAVIGDFNTAAGDTVVATLS